MTESPLLHRVVREAARRTDRWIFLALALLSPVALGEDLHVPGEYPSIQLAIDAAADGDRVLVADGVYNEALNLHGKRIELIGSGADCVLDGAGLGVSIITAGSGEPIETTVRGFTLTNGEGTFDERCFSGFVDPARFGGAIFIEHGALTIEECVFERNGNSAGDDNVGGACVYLDFADATISGCSFRDNAAVAEATVAGSALFACTDGGTLLIENCEFDRNRSNFGALHIRGLESVLIVDSVFRENSGGSSSAIWAQSGTDTSPGFDGSAGVFEVLRCVFLNNDESAARLLAKQDGAIVLRDSYFEGNSATWGAGADVIASWGNHDNPPPWVLVEGCVFFDNHAVGDGTAVLGGGLQAHISEGGEIGVVNSLFAGNSAGYAGGGLAALVHVGSRQARLRIANNTIVQNSAVRHGAGAYAFASADNGGEAIIELANNIVWNNAGPSQIRLEEEGAGSLARMQYSLVQDGFAGEGNISEPPIFVDPDGPDDDPETLQDNDYRLAAGSPGIDAADNSQIIEDLADLDGDGDFDEPTPHDADGNLRRVDDSDTDDTGVGPDPIVDMGAYEFQIEGCPADLDGGDADAKDFFTYLDLFAAGDARADIDGDGDLDADDFFGYLDLFIQAC